MAQPTRCTILWNNVVPGPSSYIESVANTFDDNFPISNLYGNDIYKIAKTNSQGIKWYRMDLGGSVTYDTIMFANHNITGSGNFKLGNGSSQWPTANLDLIRGTNCYYYYWDDIQSASDRYISIGLWDLGGTPYQTVGIMWVGKRLELARNPQIPIDLLRNKETIHLATGGGQQWSYDGHTKLGYGFKFIENFEAGEPSSFASLEEMHIDRGFAKPFFLDLKPGDSNTPPMLVHTTDWDFSVDGKDMRPGSWVVEQEI